MEGDMAMSRKEQRQLEVYGMVKEGVLTLVEAAERLAIGYRQVRRNYQKYRLNEVSGLVHKLRGRPSNHQVSGFYRQAVLAFYQENLKGFNLNHASEKLAENGLEVNPETLRRWLISEGQWIPRKRKKRQHHRQWRKRRERIGNMIQMDGSFHHWFGDDREDCLMVMTDDADNTIYARLFHEETTRGALKTLRDWIELYGIPSSLHTDRETVCQIQRASSIEEKRRVNSDWTIRYRNGIYQLKGLLLYLPAKSYVTVQEHLDGTLHIDCRGKEVSYAAPRPKKIQASGSHR
jgi:hypothetical protein